MLGLSLFFCSLASLVFLVFDIPSLLLFSQQKVVLFRKGAGRQAMFTISS